MTIKISYESESAQATFEGTLQEARAFCHPRVGPHPNRHEETLAVSEDGESSVEWEGCTFEELFPEPLDALEKAWRDKIKASMREQLAEGPCTFWDMLPEGVSQARGHGAWWELLEEGAIEVHARDYHETSYQLRVPPEARRYVLGYDEEHLTLEQALADPRIDLQGTLTNHGRLKHLPLDCQILLSGKEGLPVRLRRII